MSVAYDDFSVWIEPSSQGSGYRVRARCRAGEDAAPFLLPADLNDGALVPVRNPPPGASQAHDPGKGAAASPEDPRRDLPWRGPRRGEGGVERRRFPEPDRVRFLDWRYSDQLWEVLLGKGRNLAAELVPFLRSLTRSGDDYLCQAAASALGRIGQTDPQHITYFLVEEWADPESRRQSKEGLFFRGMLLGYLFEGILRARENEEYQQGCLQLLHWLLQDDRVEPVRVAVISLFSVATYDRRCFNFALNALRAIAEKRLQPQWDALRELADRMREREEILRLFGEIFEIRGTVEEIPKRAAILFGRLIVERQSLPLLRSFEDTLTGLFFSTREQRAVLEKLLEWLQEDRDSVGPLVTYLFLKPGGISSLLERTTPAADVAGAEPEGSPFLEAAHDDSEARAALARFLEQIHIQTRVFPGLLNVLLQESFRSLLASWAREGKGIPRLRPAAVDLLGRLFESRDEDVSGLILHLVQDQSSAPDRNDLRQLAIEAVTRPVRG